MPGPTSQEIRAQFISFFTDKNHTVVSPAPLPIENDPTLLFTNAGMNQFKDILLGTGTRPYSRAVNSQPCLRVSGKHNDLEEVGKDTYHHTMFEMLGNWSFGDYYKAEAIQWAWEFLTDILHFPKDRLIVTIFDSDEEAFEIWQSHTDISPDRIVRCGEKDNFWEMGETGPCGPCSEIHIDLADPKNASSQIERDPETGGLSDRYMELWNLVFIQYNRNADKSLQDLPQKHIDTGAGLERITAFLQNTTSNYNTDLFLPIIRTIEGLTNHPYHEDSRGMPHRVMADHIRSLVFSIADNVRPTNEGRGYVIRRLLRRALRYATHLNINSPILFKLVEPVIEIMGDHYTSLSERAAYISTIIHAEEESFLRTLDAGTKHFNGFVASLKEDQEKSLSGHDAFLLYDTYGFPIDLTQVMAEEQGLDVNLTEFQSLLTEQRERSRRSHKEKKHPEKKQPDASQSDNQYIDDTIPNASALVHQGVYHTTAGGGESHLPANPTERFRLAQHHTATHLLLAALRDQLGTHVTQAGSLVEPQRLRFDFSHHHRIDSETLLSIVEAVNHYIKQNLSVHIQEMPIETAKSQGAIATFGEKYDDVVRVVTIADISKELCGGNHVTSISSLEAFKIIQSTSISAGTRRIEAIVGSDNMSRYNTLQKGSIITQIHAKHAALYKLDPKTPALPDDLASLSLSDLKTRLSDLISAHKLREKQQRKSQSQNATSQIQDLKDAIKPIPNTPYSIVAHQFENVPVPVLRDISDKLLNQYPDLIVVLSATQGDSATLLIKLSGSITSVISAPTLTQHITSITGGNGGGRPDMSQAGGLSPDKISDAFDSLESYIQSQHP